jgi:hypothetical protein
MLLEHRFLAQTASRSAKRFGTIFCAELELKSKYQLQRHDRAKWLRSRKRAV